jgi:hypothetical protein
MIEADGKGPVGAVRRKLPLRALRTNSTTAFLSLRRRNSSVAGEELDCAADRSDDDLTGYAPARPPPDSSKSRPTRASHRESTTHVKANFREPGATCPRMGPLTDSDLPRWWAIEHPLSIMFGQSDVTEASRHRTLRAAPAAADGKQHACRRGTCWAAAAVQNTVC